MGTGDMLLAGNPAMDQHPVKGEWGGVAILLGMFRAEKRSAQASAHPLSQAQGGLFSVC